ncbi:MAG: ABC transporter permease [Ruminococcus sp.]|nr:ABC transporter permease [Ruminococcus sp.]
MVKLIRSGFRKDRAILSVFLMIIVISTFLLHSGLFASVYPRLYDDYAREQGLCDCLMWTSADHERIDSTLEGFEGVESYKVQDMVSIASLTLTTSKSSKEKKDSGWLVQRFGDNVGYKQFEFLKLDNSVGGRRIYLNEYTAVANDLCVGDTVTVSSDLGEFEYTVAGTYQHLHMGNSYYMISVMVDEDSFRELSEAAEKSGANMRMVYMYTTDGSDMDEVVQNAVTALRGSDDTYTDGHSQVLSKSGYTVIVNILAGFMAAFAAIIIVICVIMIVFTINNNISRDIVNIGALRAVGHTVGQIRAALTAEYVILGAVGTGVGIALSYVLFPVIEKLFIREISGIVWKQQIYPAITLGVLAGVLIVVMIVAFLSTVKIKKLHPATALRFGLRANSFKKNHLPLSESRGGLNILLALKSSMQNMGQNIVVFCIIAAVAFVTTFSGLLFYNTKVDITAFQRMVQGDAPDSYVYLADNSYGSACSAIEEISAVDGVSQAYGLFSVSATVGGGDVTLIYITEPDFVYCGIYEGEIMRSDNEVVVGSVVADRLGVGVGDEITVEYGDNSRRYLVTGLQQSVMNNRLYMTDKGAQQLGVDTRYDLLRVRIDDATAERVDEINGTISELDSVTECENYYREQRSTENTPVFAVSFIVMLMILLSIATVLLVIRLLLKTVFIKKEREFGIKKAVGFTSTQLRYQLALSLMPTTLAAAVAGTLLGYFLLNPLFTLILGGYGVRNADLLHQPLVIAIAVAAVTVMVFIFCFVMSGRMKKLSAYRLIQE